MQEEQPLLVLPAGEVTRTALIFSGPLPLEAWQDIGQRLACVESGLQWWVGDWLVFGEAQYGDEIYNSGLLERWDYATLQNMKWVAKKIEPSRRHENLSWSHHQEVASFKGIESEEEQNQLLHDAEEKGWSVKELRTAIRKQLNTGPPLVAITFRVLESDETIVNDVLRAAQQETGTDDRNQNFMEIIRRYRDGRDTSV